MEEGNNSENHLTSAAAFVEGGIQEASDDSCSICLEDFCDSDPSTVCIRLITPALLIGIGLLSNAEIIVFILFFSGR